MRLADALPEIFEWKAPQKSWNFRPLEFLLCSFSMLMLAAFGLHRDLTIPLYFFVFSFSFLFHFFYFFSSRFGFLIPFLRCLLWLSKAFKYLCLSTLARLLLFLGRGGRCQGPPFETANSSPRACWSSKDAAVNSS
jgi:hypothetical protein